MLASLITVRQNDRIAGSIYATLEIVRYGAVKLYCYGDATKVNVHCEMLREDGFTLYTGPRHLHVQRAGCITAVQNVGHLRHRAPTLPCLLRL